MIQISKCKSNLYAAKIETRKVLKEVLMKITMKTECRTEEIKSGNLYNLQGQGYSLSHPCNEIKK